MKFLFSAGLALLAFAAAAWSMPAFAQTQTPIPFPRPSGTPASPKVPLHAEIFVDTNKLGQVSHIVSIKPSGDKGFNTQVYGNASQAYIRTPGGDAVPGVYRLSYDYDPKTHKVNRTVDLVKSGGVDVNAPGIVTAIQKNLDEAQKQHQAQAQAQGPVKLPDFDKISTPAPSH